MRPGGIGVDSGFFILPMSESLCHAANRRTPRPVFIRQTIAGALPVYWACDTVCAGDGAMPMIFLHPLARYASFFTAKKNDGSEYRVLAVVTTLEL
jgi:hypothetical protein